MAIPFRPVGIGAVAAMKVLRVNFSQALSQIPELHAWDDFNCNTVTGKIFTGTTVNGSKPMMGAIGLSAAPSSGWWPSAAVAGAAVDAASRLIGSTGWCKLSAAPPGAGGDVYFNFNFSFPSDVVPSDVLAAVLALTYRYTGTVPSVTWYGNDGGSEATPVWTALTSQPKGTNAAASVLRPSDAGGDGVGDVVTIPTSGESFPAEIWVTAAA